MNMGTYTTPTPTPNLPKIDRNTSYGYARYPPRRPKPNNHNRLKIALLAIGLVLVALVLLQPFSYPPVKSVQPTPEPPIIEPTPEPTVEPTLEPSLEPTPEPEPIPAPIADPIIKPKPVHRNITNVTNMVPPMINGHGRPPPPQNTTRDTDIVNTSETHSINGTLFNPLPSPSF